MNITVKKLPQAEIQLDIIVDAKTFASYYNTGLKHVQEVIEVDGFRKGNVPEHVIVAKYGEMIILEEMANLALRDAYIEAIKQHKLSPVADPKVTITKLAKDNPLEFTMVFPVYPEVKLPNYKAVAANAGKGHVSEEVTDKDIEDVLKELAKGRAHEHAHAHDPNHTHDDHKEHTHELPPIDDAFAKSFGEDFQTIAHLKAKVKENLSLEKAQKAKEKKRTAIMEALIKETQAEVPEALIEMELSRMLIQMKGDITRFGGTWEEYLKHGNTTEEKLKGTWKHDALKRTLSQLILAEIALVEKISPTDEEIETELVRLLASVQDADEERAKAYLNQVLTHEKVLSFLETDEE